MIGHLKGKDIHCRNRASNTEKEEAIMTNERKESDKYNNMPTVNGISLKVGEVLVPWWLQDEDRPSLVEKKYIRTWKSGSFRYHVCFIPIPEEKFETYMKEFNREINAYAQSRREGRCVIEIKPDGTKKICPSSRRCENCPYKGMYERYNPHRVDILSLDYENEENKLDIPDSASPSVEEIVLDKMYPKPSEEELLADMLDHFDCEHPRYAGIIRGKLQNKSNDEIFKKHKLGKSRGYQEVENTYYAAYTFLMCRNCS